MEREPNTTTTYAKLVDALSRFPRYLDNRGGARSGKTIAELQLLADLARADKTPTVNTVASDTLPHLKRGAIRDFKLSMQVRGLWREECWSRSECIYYFPSGSVIEFYGIADSPAKALGPARHRLVINEANLIDWESARQMFARTSGLIIYDYNPSAPFWGTDIVPRRGRYEMVHSTYQDNEFLPDEVRREIEANRDSPNWWRVYGLGLIGQVEGQVFDFKLIDQMPDAFGLVESYGMDFGFTHDPTTLVRCLIDTARRTIYADELLWQTGMTNPDIAAALKEFGITRTGPVVWADAAEPKSIAEVAGYGLNVRACDKRVTVREQIQTLRSWTIYVTRRSVNLQDEGRKYTFKQTRDGTWTNEPIEFFNHGMDALRYGTLSQMSNAGYGVYAVSMKPYKR